MVKGCIINTRTFNLKPLNLERNQKVKTILVVDNTYRIRNSLRDFLAKSHSGFTLICIEDTDQAERMLGVSLNIEAIIIDANMSGNLAERARKNYPKVQVFENLEAIKAVLTEK
ncbi:MAG: hypothetical protein NTW11_03765 [Candidatus Staskawiczbacteria bacterium]|nr:hypothetical protein [Candidatus Staskawiczbacteria bacterium]